MRATISALKSQLLPDGSWFRIVKDSASKTAYSPPTENRYSG